MQMNFYCYAQIPRLLYFLTWRTLAGSAGGKSMKDASDSESPQERLASVFMKCRSLISRVVGRIARPHDVEDIVQEVFIRCFEIAGKNPIRYPRSFMLKTARNLAINRVTRGGYGVTECIGDFDTLETYPDGDSVESSVDAKRQFLLFCRAVRTLPVQCRRAFVLKKVYGFSQREIAEFMGLSENTVEKHIHKGLKLCSAFMRSHSVEHVRLEPSSLPRKGRKRLG